MGESQFSDRAHLQDIQSEAGRVAMGLSPIKADGKSEDAVKLAREANSILGF